LLEIKQGYYQRLILVCYKEVRTVRKLNENTAPFGASIHYEARSSTLSFENLKYFQRIRVFGCAPARSDQGHLIFLFLFPSREKENRKYHQGKKKERERERERE